MQDLEVLCRLAETDPDLPAENDPLRCLDSDLICKKHVKTLCILCPPMLYRCIAFF